MNNDEMNKTFHDLRTPLAIIKEGLSLLLDEIPGKVNDAQRSILEKARNSTDKLTRMLEEFRAELKSAKEPEDEEDTGR